MAVESETVGRARRIPKPLGRPQERKVRIRYPYLAVDLQSPVVYRDQLFFPGGQKDIPSNRGNRTIRVDCWTTHCAECGKLFGFYTVPRCETKPFGWLRRCDAHRQKGKKIDPALFRATRPAFHDVAGMVAEGKRMWERLLDLWEAQDRAEKALRDEGQDLGEERR